MKLTRIILKALLALLVFAVTSLSSAAAATPFDACDNMMNKLSVFYSIRGFPESLKDSRSRYANGTRKYKSTRDAAEQTVAEAYGVSRKELDLEWPGFYDFSSALIAVSISGGLSAGDFREFAMMSCLKKYG